MAIGIIGGLMLGPLAFLMFFITGVVGGDTNRKCPHCAEFVKAAAKICKHCHQPLPPLVSMRPADGSDRPARPPAVRPSGSRPAARPPASPMH